jgi:aminopeptidase N
MMLAALLLLQAVPAPLAARPDTVRPLHDALNYDITLVVGDTGRHILGEVETTWRLGSDEPVEVPLDSALRVIRVLLDGRPNTRISRTMYARSTASVVMPHAKHAGDTLHTRIRYHGEPRDGLVIGTNVRGGRSAFADNWPDRAHYWLPVQDHPSDKATVSFHVQAPAALQVIANGTLQRVDTLPYGHLVWHYRLDTPVPSYTMVVGVARFARTRLPDAGCTAPCVPQTVWTYPADSAYAVDGPFRRTPDMLDYFSRTFGAFPYPSLAHVQSSTRYGGMENSTAIFYDEKAYRDRKLSEEVVAHEIAHQWFGDAVTEADWHHLWLSEGFATYLAGLWVGHADGDSAFTRYMAQQRDKVFGSGETLRPILDTAATDLMSLLNSNNYQKGAWTLHQLRGLVGDSAFFGGMRAYYAAHRDGTALSADFAAQMSKAAGRDLGWYFAQALAQPGYPRLDLTWRHRGNRLLLDVRQVQPTAWGTFRLPGLEVRIDGTVHRIDVAGRQSRHEIRGVRTAPREVVVDPDGHWLLEATVPGGARGAR